MDGGRDRWRLHAAGLVLPDHRAHCADGVAGRRGSIAGLAALRHERCQAERAIVDLDQAIRLDPGDPRALTVRGSLWRAKRGLDLAIADLDRAIAIDPTSASAFHERGLIRYAQGALDRAVADFGEAIRLDAKAPDPY